MDLSVAVLVDEHTGSMAELFAAALHESGVATLIGRTTSGNVAGGQLFELADGAALDVTTLELTSAHGHALAGNGITPDVPVEGSRAT